MIELLLIGVGAGDPEHLTLQAVRALNSADVVLIPCKGEDKTDLADLRRAVCAGALTAPTPIVEFDLPTRNAQNPEYLKGVNDWHDAVASAWREQLTGRLPNGGRAAFLVWGDPSLYDSSMRIAERLRADGAPLAVKVIPGVTSLQALTAAHGIPLNDLGGSVMITTGRKLRDEGWPAGADTVAVMLDGACAFQTLPSDGVFIWWAAYLGMPHEVKLSGPLSKIGEEIIATRARARADHGWIMDTYILRRQKPIAGTVHSDGVIPRAP